MAETAPVSRSNRLSLLLAVTLLAVLIGCGPTPSEEASRKESGTGTARGTGTVAGGKGDNPRAEPVPLSSADAPTPRASHMQSLPAMREQPARMPEHLVLPERIAKELESPGVSVRLRALDRWAQQGPKGLLDPLLVALEDEDEAVRAKALAIIEQQVAIEPEREEVGGEQ